LSKKVVVGHAGNRDSYEIVKAFHNCDRLEKFVTDVYFPPASAKILVNKDLPIPWSKVKLSFKSIGPQIFNRLGLKPNYSYADNEISKVSLDCAVNGNSNLLLYSYYAYHAFQKIEQSQYPIKRFLFQLHPHPHTIIDILKPEIDRLPFTKSSILKENEFNYNADYVDKLSNESRLADHIFVASTFTKQSLLDNGISDNKVSVIPYGVDTTKYYPKPSYSHSGKLNLLFIGSMVQRKGLADLLQAMRMLKSELVQLTLVGRTIVDYELLDEFKDLNIDIRINVSHDDLTNIMHKSDVFVFPSLAEGFAHVLLEAMAVGLPIIATKNTAAPDLIEHGLEGFIIDIKNSSEIAKHIEILIDNKAMLQSMGKAALEKSKHFTWEKFRETIVEKYSSLA
jgi:glycosyltransferase involved in cell wall biosynthesis